MLGRTDFRNHRFAATSGIQANGKHEYGVKNGILERHRLVLLVGVFEVTDCLVATVAGPLNGAVDLFYLRMADLGETFQNRGRAAAGLVSRRK